MRMNGRGWATLAYGSATLCLIATLPVLFLALLGQALDETENPPAYVPLGLLAAGTMVLSYGWGLSRLSETPRSALLAFVVPPPLVLWVGIEMFDSWDAASLALPIVMLVPPLTTWRSTVAARDAGQLHYLEWDSTTRMVGIAIAQTAIAVITLYGWWSDDRSDAVTFVAYPLASVAGLALLRRGVHLRVGGWLLVGLSGGVLVEVFRRTGAEAPLWSLVVWAWFGGLAMVAGLMALRDAR